MATKEAFNKTFATFARMWSATMFPIIRRSGGWPGFRYTSEEEGEMRKQVKRFSNLTLGYFCFLAVNTAITLLLMGALLFPIILSVEAMQRAHGALPDTFLGAALGAAVGLILGIGIPLGCYLTCAILGIIPWNSDLTAADAEFRRRLFAKFCRQTTRVGALVCVGMLVLALWPDTKSTSTALSNVASVYEVPLWKRIALPLTAGLINVLTLWYYYGPNRRS